MRDETSGIPGMDRDVAERVSNGIDYFDAKNQWTWPTAIIVAHDRFGSFDVAEPGQRPHDIVYGVPSSRGHAQDVARGFCPRMNEDGEMLTRCWLEAARVAVMRVPS